MVEVVGLAVGDDDEQAALAGAGSVAIGGVAQGRAEGAGNYYASPVAGDGKVYFASERGVITILQAGRQWETLGARELGQRVMATPVIRDGKIYLRTDEALYCFAVQ